MLKRKGNSCMLLMEMTNSVAIMETTMESPQKYVKIEHQTIQQSHNWIE